MWNWVCQSKQWTSSCEPTIKLQGSVSVINILLGIGILSMPFAMRSAGAAGVLSVVFCCFLFCTTGKFIHWGLDLIPANVPRDYPSLGEAAVGPIGRTLVSIAAALELSGGTCMTLIILWRSIEVRPCSTPALLVNHIPVS